MQLAYRSHYVFGLFAYHLEVQRATAVYTGAFFRKRASSQINWMRHLQLRSTE